MEREGGGGGDDSYTKAQTDALLAEKADKSTTYTKTEVDYEIDSEVGTAIAALDVSSTSETGHVIRSIGQEDGKIAAVAELVDTTPTPSSLKLCTSGGIYDAIQAAGGGGTDLTPVNVGAKAATFPTEYMYVLEKHLPFTTGETFSSYGGTTWTYYSENNSFYIYIQYLEDWTSTPLTDPIVYRYAAIKKSDKTWIQGTSSQVLTEITTKTLPELAFKGHTTSLSSNYNLNTLPCGLYYCHDATSVSHSPTTNPFFIECQEVRYSIVATRYVRVKQILTDFTTNDVYYRTYDDGTWSSWYKINATVVS